MSETSISSYLSRKVAVLSFFGIVMVVFIHSSMPGGEKYFCYDLLLKIIIVIAPIFKSLFFVISGYLFFSNVRDMSSIWQKLKRRISTLLIPYLLVNFLAYCSLGLLKALPATGAFVNASTYLGSKSGLNWLQLLSKLFFAPYMFHLWFVKTLIIVMLLTPLLFFLLRKRAAGTALLTGLGVVCLLEELGIGANVFAAVNSVTADFCFALFCVSLGGFIASNHSRLAEKRFSWRWSAAAFAVLLAAAFVSRAIAGSLIDLWYLLLFIFVFMVYDAGILRRVRGSAFMDRIIPYTFFIYLFHMPWMNIPKKLLFRLPLSEGIRYCTVLLLSPLIVIAVLLVAANLLERFLPGVYSVLTGGRGTARRRKA